MVDVIDVAVLEVIGLYEHHTLYRGNNKRTSFNELRKCDLIVSSSGQRRIVSTG